MKARAAERVRRAKAAEPGWPRAPCADAMTAVCHIIRTIATSKPAKRPQPKPQMAQDPFAASCAANKATVHAAP